MIPKKILAFGTFDIFHPGHEFFLREAKKQGEHLSVVLARDDTVNKVKGVPTVNDELARLAMIKSLDYVDYACLGSEDNKYEIITELKPDIIFLGYDQNAFVDGLSGFLDKNGISCKVLRLKDSLKPEVYKSSKLRGGLDHNKE
ncbi:MAG: adenylyltransferase/cytidyltransferase family protein [Candidatus Woesearchaeota archaeon]